MKRATKEFIKKFIPMNLFRNIREFLDAKEIQSIGKQTRDPFNKLEYPIGINLVGMFTEDSGLGQSTRLVAKEIERSDIEHHFIEFYVPEYTIQSNDSFKDKLTNEYKYGINLIHVNMDDFSYFYKHNKDTFQGHYNIAYWLWEVSDFPEKWIPLINQLDEVWTPAEYVSESIRKVTNKPVRTIPYSVEAEYDEKYDREYFHLPNDQFLVLMMYDFNSISERKNPKGCIEAFKKAYSKEDNVGIVIKISHADENEFEQLKQLLDGYNVYFIDKILTKVEVNSLIHDVDVYLSLHRAEGFGLVLAESMLMKTATVASNYSANTEFQTKENSCLVDCSLINVGQDIYPYKKEYVWGDPNIEQASEYLKKLYSDKDFYNQIVNQAYKDMTSEDKKLIPSKLIEQYVKEIYEGK